MEVLFRKVRPVGTPRHPGNQGAARVGEGLPGIAVAISSIAHGLCHRHTGVGFARLHQFQRPQVVRSVAGQYLHRGDQLGVGVHHNRRLVAVEPPAAALVAVAHLRVMHRHHPVPAHPVLEAHSTLSPFHVPRSGPGAGSGAATAPAVPPPPQSAGAPHCPPATPPRACRDNSKSRSASATSPASSAVRARLSDQSMAASPFTLEPRYLSYSRAWAHSLTGACSTAASARNNLTIPSANRL